MRMWYNRLSIHNLPESGRDAAGIMDIIDGDGDILDNFFLSQKALNMFVRKFKLKVVNAQADQIEERDSVEGLVETKESE